MPVELMVLCSVDGCRWRLWPSSGMSSWWQTRSWRSCSTWASFMGRFLLQPGLHWHPRAMPLFPALCSSCRWLPSLHCRSCCWCSASSCCHPRGFRRLEARRALVPRCRSGAHACREGGHCGCEGAEPTTSFFVGVFYVGGEVAWCMSIQHPRLGTLASPSERLLVR